MSKLIQSFLSRYTPGACTDQRACIIGKHVSKACLRKTLLTVRMAPPFGDAAKARPPSSAAETRAPCSCLDGQGPRGAGSQHSWYASQSTAPRKRI